MSLKPRSELQREQSKTMDLVDVNQVLEVPDTPDRLGAATHDSNASMNNRKMGKDYMNGRIRNQPKENGKSVKFNSNQRLFIHPESCRNSIVSQQGSSTSLKQPRPPYVDLTTRHEKGKALCNSDVQKFSSFAGLNDQNGHGHSGINRVNASRKGVLSLNCIPPIDASRKSSKIKGVDILAADHHKAESMQPCTSSKVPKQKMLVRNGCISPHNIAKSERVAKKQETGIVVKEVKGSSGTFPSEGQSSTVDIKELIAEAKDSQRYKGKGVLNYPSSKEPDTGSSHLPHRRAIHNEPSTESEGWRTTHNHRKQRDIELQKKGIMQKDHKNERDIEILDVFSSPQTVSPHTHLLSTNRQKEGTPSRNLGKRSMPRVNDSIDEASTSRSKRNKSIRVEGTSNLSPEPNTHANEDPSVRALQVEADEMLARELQEQLYNEELTPGVQIDEMDSHFAFAMPPQQDNSSLRSGARRQAPSLSNAREQVQPSSSRRSSIQRRLQPQSRASTRTSQLRTRLRAARPHINSSRRSSIFPSNMDVDMRIEILETLEAVGVTGRPNNLLQIRREFNEDDYEMLLALDEDNHRHGGATSAQINNLPESTVQAENLQECSICLETPTIGETIRHLPCLHRFHKVCIDEWLRRKTLCPVCKSSIT